MKLLFSLLIILFLNYNYINCSKVQFNNSIVSNCLNINSPCDITSRKVWNNNELPANGDDVLIDFSNESNSPIYLIANNFHLQLNSLTINGQKSGSGNDYFTTLTVQNSNLTINQDFNISLSNINFNQELSSNYQITVNSFNSDNGLLNFVNGYSSFDSVNINGPNPVSINQNSSIVVNNQAVFNSPIQHTSTGLFKLSGVTTISNNLNSNGTVTFDTTSSVTISFTSSFNELSIDSQVSVLGGPKTNVTISNLNTNTLGQIIVSQQSNVAILDSINSINILSDEVIVTENSQIYLPSGYNIYQLSDQTNGTYIIMDSVSATTFQGCTASLYLGVISNGNITVSGSVMDVLQMIAQGSISGITITTSGYVYNVIAPNSNIIVSKSSQFSTQNSTSYETYVYGTLFNYNNFTTNTLYIAQSGAVNSYSNIVGDIIDYSSTIKFYRPRSISSLYIYYGGSLIMNTEAPLTVYNNLTLEHDSIIEIYQPELNSQLPQFIVDGVLSIGENVNIDIIFNTTDISPKNNDRILLFNTSNSVNNNFDSPVISVKALFNDITSKYKFNILNEDGIYSLEFISNGSDNHNNSDSDSESDNNDGGKGSLSKGKIAAIIVVPLIVIIAVIVIIFKLKKKNKNNNHHERKPLL